MDKAPDAFRTISEVAEELDVPQHVLRFWETRFTQIKPMKRSGGRRFYRPDDVDLLRGIRRLLYAEGYTIRGVQRILKEQGVKAVQGIDAADREAIVEPAPEPRATPKATSRKSKAPPIVVAQPAPEIEDEEEEEAAEESADIDEEEEDFAEDDADEVDPTSIVVSPPLPKPFSTPLPALELRRGQPTGMVPRSATLPQAPRPPKVPPAATPPAYLPDIMFETPMPRRPQAAPPPQPEPVVEPVIEVMPVRPPAPDSTRLRPILDELMAVRRLLDAAMLPNEP